MLFENRFSRLLYFFWVGVARVMFEVGHEATHCKPHRSGGK